MRADAYFLASYCDPTGSPRAGLVIDERIIDVEEVGSNADDCAARSVLSILAHWAELHPLFQQFARSTRDSDQSSGKPVAAVQLLAPVLYPGAIFCAGANYKNHVQEMSLALGLAEEPDPRELGLKPWHFIKPAFSCIRGPGATISLPAYSDRVDWEAEIALVIGRLCRNVSVAEALSHVAGLTIVNDLSARDHISRANTAAVSPFHFDWLSHKCFDGALPMGPWICPLEQIDDLERIAIKLWVNDRLMQDSSTEHLIFSFAEQVSHLSSRLTLRPGDVIATGTPAGCGAARGTFLQPGDRIKIVVDGIGGLVNYIASEPSRACS